MPSHHETSPPPHWELQGKGKGKGKKGKGKGGKGKGAKPPSFNRLERRCMLFLAGECVFTGAVCPMGRHERIRIPKADQTTVLGVVKPSTFSHVQRRWKEAGGVRELVGVFRVQNPRLAAMYQITRGNLMSADGVLPDEVDGWHGTREENILGIALEGFDPERRSGQVYGEGEYFAKDPNVSIGYCHGGSYMFFCKLLLGQPGRDHTWVEDCKYYVMQQAPGKVLALPMFVVQFKDAPARAPLSTTYAAERQRGKMSQRGVDFPTKGRADALMEARETKYLWVGWLDPTLTTKDDSVVEDDVRDFLQLGASVKCVIPERNGNRRVGAYVELHAAISRDQVAALAHRPYHGEYIISVDDAQPENPWCAKHVCPRLVGASGYCRGWNLRGHKMWWKACSFRHPTDRWPTAAARGSLQPLDRHSAKYDSLRSEIEESAFHNGRPRVGEIFRVVNPDLERLYQDRMNYHNWATKYAATEMELWHGTNCSIIPELLSKGFMPPSDTAASDQCPVSGGKGLTTTLCGNDCPHCTEPHQWSMCHMYGLGVYLADTPAKSHRYVKNAKDGRHQLLVCRANLGVPYAIHGNLLAKDAMHDFTFCDDPTDLLEQVAEEWDLLGHGSYYVHGMKGRERKGLGVHNNEYVVFHPWRVLPLYVVEYTLVSP
eukprot:Sspe_Gene.12849::Locus_4401_Transcript_1_1_Confidence_1.000_Length_2103::g.12849::m.12849